MTIRTRPNAYDSIRRFVRYDIGNPPLYFLDNNGVHLVEENIDNISLHFPANVLSQIDDFGFYTMLIYSNVFFLEVTPRSELTREVFLKKESQKLIGTGFIYTQLRVLEYITDMDFTLRRLYGKK